MHYQSNRLDPRFSNRWGDEQTFTEAKPPRRADATARWAMIVLVVAAAVARLALLDVPFARNHESTASGPMVCAARNLVRYGMISQRFCGVLNTGQVPKEQWVWYAHHPPLVVMAIAWSSELFGKSEWCYRLPSAVFSVLGTAMIFVLVNRRFGWQTALAAGLIHAFSPFAWMFANMPDVVGPQMVFFGLGTVYCYLRWREVGHRRWLWLMCASWLLCALSDWSAYFMPPVLALHYILIRPPKQWFWAGLRVTPFAVVAALLLGGTFAWLLSTPDRTVVGQMFNRIDGAVPAQNDQPAGFGLWWRVGVQYYYANTQTRLVLALIAAYALTLAVLAVRRRWASFQNHDATIMLLLWGLLHVMVGMQSSIQHMWVWCVLVPGTSMAAAVALRHLWMAVPARVRVWPKVPYVMATLAMGFAGYSYLRANQMIVSEFRTRETCGYSLQDFGKFLNKVTKHGEGILTSDASDPEKGDSEPGLWFYADRQLRTGIRTVDQLNANLGAGPYRLYYDYVQPNGPKPSWFIMPAAHFVRFPELSAELDSRFERWVWQDYVMWYLLKPSTPTTQPAPALQPPATQPAAVAPTTLPTDGPAAWIGILPKLP